MSLSAGADSAPADGDATQDRPDWVNVHGIAWVLDEAPVPADLALVLLAVARRADTSGKGSRQSKATIAAKTGKSEAQVHRDITRLCELKLLKLGDQQLVAHLPVGRRPVVYDLCMDRRGPKPVKGSKNPTGQKKPAEPSGDARGCMDATPGMGATPCMDATPRGGMDARGRGGMDATQKNPMNNPVEEPSSLSARSVDWPEVDRKPAPRQRERDDPSVSSDHRPTPTVEPATSTAHRLLAAEGVDRDEADRLIPQITRGEPKGPAWWRTVRDRGDLAELIAHARQKVQRDNTCERCGGTGKRAIEWCGSTTVVDCGECMARCDTHPTYVARHCSACRADQLAAGVKPSVNGRSQSPADRRWRDGLALAREFYAAERLDAVIDGEVLSPPKEIPA